MYDTISRYYDQIHAGLVEDIPFVLRQAAVSDGPVLEVGSGSGRLLLPLARAGHEVTGIDNSPNMLALAEARLAAEPAAIQACVRLVMADVTRQYLPEVANSYGLALLGYNTFMHFDEPQAAAVLRQAVRLLRPDGVLLLDLENPFDLAALEDSPKPVLEQSWRDDSNKCDVEQYAAYRVNTADQVVDVDWTFTTTPDNGEAGTETPISIHYYYRYPHQLETLLQRAGWKPLAFYGDYDESPFEEESKRLLVTAVKTT